MFGRGGGVGDNIFTNKKRRTTPYGHLALLVLYPRMCSYFQDSAC